MQELSLLISTLDDGIYNIPRLFQPVPEIEYVIIHQVSDKTKNASYATIHQQLTETSFKLFVINETGLSKSRNQALQNADCELMLLCDDDIAILPGGITSIIQSGAKYDDTDIFAFKIKTDNGADYKKYPGKFKELSGKSLASVSSTEMVIRKSWWLKNKVLFDEQFGLGARYPTGEEFIFLKDAEKKGAKITFIPEYIASHPGKGSGSTYSTQMIEAKGAMFARIYGINSVFMNFGFAVKKYPECKSVISFNKFLKHIYYGSRQFRKNKNPQ